MGSQMCIHAPAENEGQQETAGSRRRRDSSDSDEEGATPMQRIGLESKMAMHSTDFRCDPTEYFRSNIGNYCRRQRLPQLDEPHRFNFYVWSSNQFGCGHDSIVIGSHCPEDNEYGYITAELRVDDDEERVFPNTEYLNKYEAMLYVHGEDDKRRWKYQYSYETTLNSLIDLVLNLIANHGRYSNLHNGCQHFVEAFLQKIVEAEQHRRIECKLAHNSTKSSNQCVNGLRRYMAHQEVSKQMKAEGLFPKYDTMESNLQLAGTALVLPVVAMAISKETVKSQRHRVCFQCVKPTIRHHDIAVVEGKNCQKDCENNCEREGVDDGGGTKQSSESCIV